MELVHASFPSAYMSSSDLWMDLLNLQTCHSFAPFVVENMYIFFVFPFPGLPNSGAIFRIPRKHRIWSWTPNGCLKPPRRATLLVSLETPKRETPPSPVRIRWKVIRLNLAPLFGLIQQCCRGVCCGFFFGGAASWTSGNPWISWFFQNGSPPPKKRI